MFDTIIVPTDGSDQAHRALATAAELARQHDATVHVLTVVDSRFLGKATEIDDAEATASADLAEFTAAVDTEGLSVTTGVRHGIPDEEIRTYATDHDADLVVMGTHGRTGVRRYVLGSVAEKVVRLSDVPVLTVHGTDGGADVSFENILVPTDGSEGARAAARPAAAVAKPTDATVHALSVVDVRSMGVDVRSDLILDELPARCTGRRRHHRGRPRDRGCGVHPHRDRPRRALPGDPGLRRGQRRRPGGHGDPRPDRPRAVPPRKRHGETRPDRAGAGTDRPGPGGSRGVSPAWRGPWLYGGA
ncbi:universal stress protein [Haloarcula regularis]